MGMGYVLFSFETPSPETLFAASFYKYWLKWVGIWKLGIEMPGAIETKVITWGPCLKYYKMNKITYISCFDYFNSPIVQKEKES